MAECVTRGRFTLVSIEHATGRIVERISVPNLVTTAGMAGMLTWFGGQIDQPGGQFLAVGTGAGTPAAGDGTLFTELARLAPIQASVSGGTLTMQTFFTTAQGNGTWTNAGVFGISATGTLNSGILLAHALLSYVKTSSLDTILSYALTLS